MYQRYWELFEYAMNVAGSTPETSLMIGDNPKKDIRGGKTAGMTTGWLKRGKFFSMDLGGDVPDIVIINYMMLPGQIEQHLKQRTNEKLNTKE